MRIPCKVIVLEYRSSGKGFGLSRPGVKKEKKLIVLSSVFLPHLCG